VARRIVSGESVSAIHHEYEIKRSVLYRWRDAYLKDGEAGLRRPVGRPARSAISEPLQDVTLGARSGDAEKAADERLEKATARIAELERMLGKRTLQMDFLAGAFKRVKESRQKKGTFGETASTERSGQ
jgi:transposase-like protein